MTGIAAVAAWLAEVIGKKKLGEALESGSSRDNRMLRRALNESQAHRDELAGVREILIRVDAHRERLQAENILLRVENNGLRAERAARKAAS